MFWTRLYFTTFNCIARDVLDREMSRQCQSQQRCQRHSGTAPCFQSSWHRVRPGHHWQEPAWRAKRHRPTYLYRVFHHKRDIQRSVHPNICNCESELNWFWRKVQQFIGVMKKDAIWLSQLNIRSVSWLVSELLINIIIGGDIFIKLFKTEKVCRKQNTREKMRTFIRHKTSYMKEQRRQEQTSTGENGTYVQPTRCCKSTTRHYTHIKNIKHKHQQVTCSELFNNKWDTARIVQLTNLVIKISLLWILLAYFVICSFKNKLLTYIHKEKLMSILNRYVNRKCLSKSTATMLNTVSQELAPWQGGEKRWLQDANNSCRNEIDAQVDSDLRRNNYRLCRRVRP